MTFFKAVAHGVYASGREWSFRQIFSSSASLTVVEANWESELMNLWTNGAYGLETLYPTTTVLQGDSVYELQVNLGPPLRVDAIGLAQSAFSAPGTSANDGLPDQDAVLVSLRTAFPGTWARGRTYLPAIDETIVVGDLIGSVPATRVTTAMTALRSNMAAAGHVQVLLNERPTRHDPLLAIPKTVTSCKTDRVMRTQRRRVRKELAQYA
jgi:hypothetical protein